MKTTIYSFANVSEKLIWNGSKIKHVTLARPYNQPFTLVVGDDSYN